MSGFEYLSVLLSIIIGLGLTHIAKGITRSVIAEETDHTRLVYALFTILVILLNWWVIFQWSDHDNWTFSEFLVLVSWAFGHYLMAITLYPPAGSDSGSFENYRHWFMWTFVVMTLMDMAQTAMRGDFFNPWYYSIFVGHYSLLALSGVFIKSARFHRILSWWFLGVTLTWALIVRRFLT